MEEKEKETTFEMGTLYDVNRNIVQTKGVQLDEAALNSKKEIVKNYLLKTNNNYYMLLSNENKDYTIFTLGNNTSCSIEDKYKKLTSILIDECLQNRGEIRGIDLVNDNSAIEIWLSIDDNSYVYYFFPYDAAIINISDEMEA